MASSLEQRIRRICPSLPETSAREGHGSPAYFATKQFVMLWPQEHHEHEFFHLWCAAPEGAQAAFIEHDAERFFFPPYGGHRGRIGVRLDTGIDIEEIETLCVEAYRCVATKRQRALLDSSRTTQSRCWRTRRSARAPRSASGR